MKEYDDNFNDGHMTTEKYNMTSNDADVVSQDTKYTQDNGEVEIDTTKKKKGSKHPVFSEIMQWVQSIAVAVVIVFLITTFVARTTEVSGTSMLPTLEPKDRLIMTYFMYTPQINDIVIAKRDNDTAIIKRLIAKEGDKVDIDFDKGIVYVNDKALDEPYTNTPTNRQGDITFPVIVPENCYFLMGDNRNGSDDSRTAHIGMIKEENIMGHAVFRLYPFNKFGPLQ